VADPKRIVERGWDQVAESFAEWQRAIDDEERLARLDDLVGRLPSRPRVLELGSGAGVESTRLLAERGDLVGVDISAEQVRRARERIPGGRFVHADVMEVELEPASFDAVVSFYVLNNLPRQELRPLLERIRGWLRPGGWLLASLPAADNPGWQGQWLGVEMFFSGYEPAVTLGIVEDVGLHVVEQSVEVMLEPDWIDGRVGTRYDEVRWLWLLARRPDQPSSSGRRP
jgi:SAM-dependent methyltransferase